MKHITLKSKKVVDITSGCFDDCLKLTAIYVPSDLVEDYKAATNWLVYADKIQAIPE